MRNWYKFFLHKDSKIGINLERDQKFSDHEKSMGGYEANKYYKNKNLFFEKYLNGRYKTYYNFLKKNLTKKSNVLSLGSGRCVAELSLLDSGYNIICSDIDIPNCYEQSKKIFRHFKYEKLNILKDELTQKFNSIISLSMIYSFKKEELEIFFNKINESLEFNGLLIIDPGGGEDNFFSLIYDKIYLPTEHFLVFAILKLSKKKYFFFKKNQGFRFSNRELIIIAKKNGFEFVRIEESDYYQELTRSKIANFMIRKFPKTKFFLKIFGRFLPYVRIFKFKKINEKNI